LNPGGAKRALDWADDHPSLATYSTALIVFVALRVVSLVHDGPLLLAGADPDHRVALYSQFSGSAAALLGIALTILAILLALPERPSVNLIRASDTWPRLSALLLSVGLLALIALVASHVGAAVDNRSSGKEWLEQVLLASAAIAVVALLVAGLTFWLVLTEANKPVDPSVGRGAGRT
jgi:hypothetical protein